MRVLEGGRGSPILVLLHGLGATADVWRGWQPLLARRWPGRWLAPDLPGHGGSPPLPAYTFASFGASVAALVADRGLGDEPLTVLGHSLGGVVGLSLAGAALGQPVAAVVGLGIKISWRAEELERASALANRPVTWFSSYEEAAERHLRVSGLAGLLAPDDPALAAGIRHEQGRWRLAMDPATFAVGAPDLPRLLAGARAPVVLARGEHDPMNTDAELAQLGERVVTLPGLGHNAHVEAPDAVLDLIGR